MSLDIRIVAVVPSEVFECKVTHNLAAMADAAGLYNAMWRPDAIAKFAGDLIPHLQDGINNLRNDPAKFRAMNPENGWGSYEWLLQAAEEMLNSCHDFPHGEVQVSR